MITSVLLADFQFLTRQGIAMLIASIPQFEIVHQISEPNELSSAIKQVKPELIVLDVSDKDNHLIPTLKEIKKNSTIKFLIISNSQSKESIQRLLSMGVKGIITKNCSQEEITNALDAVTKNNRFFCNKILDLVVENPNKREDCEAANLSPREYEVLSLIANGSSTNQIAEKLFLSVHTINSHRKNILKKLNMKSPAELIAYAIQSGIVNIS